MRKDDHAVGRLLSRREALALLAAGAALFATRSRNSHAQRSGAAPQCVARPQQTEGPFFVDEKLNRSDIRTDPATGTIKTGAPLHITFRVSRLADRCTPLPGAIVDLWHCDAAGLYSDVRDRDVSTIGQKFLRGYQRTDASGQAVFTTIYPGWYRGRTVHLHFKVRVDGAASRAREFTSQIYFDDALTDRVLSLHPYSARGSRDRRNHQDGLFREGGKQLLMSVNEEANAYRGTFDIGLRLD
jgi:protocatechuate 3,4-dioxygenase beta subunit